MPKIYSLTQINKDHNVVNVRYSIKIYLCYMFLFYLQEYYLLVNLCVSLINSFNT